MKTITLKVMSKARRFPIIGQLITVEVDCNGAPLDRFIRRRLAEAERSDHPFFEIIKDTKETPLKEAPTKEVPTKDKKPLSKKED